MSINELLEYSYSQYSSLVNSESIESIVNACYGIGCGCSYNSYCSSSCCNGYYRTCDYVGSCSVGSALAWLWWSLAFFFFFCILCMILAGARRRRMQRMMMARQRNMQNSNGVTVTQTTYSTVPNGLQPPAMGQQA